MQMRNVASCLLRILTSGWNIHGFNTRFFFQLLPLHPIHRWVETLNEIHFLFFLASGEQVWLWSPQWEMQRPKKILHLQTTVNRRIDKSQNKFSNVIQDAWGRTISDQNVGWNSDWTNLRKLSFRFKCGRPGFRTSGGKNCWTNWCQYARLLIKRTIILL